jgi:hypothetical protein
MEEGQERDSSSDEERHIIEDEDMEDSPTDTPELWMAERNEDDTKFVRVFGDTIPTKNRAQAESELSNCRLFKRGKSFSKIWSGLVWRHRLRQSQTSTCEMQCVMRFGRGIQSRFPMASSFTTTTSGWLEYIVAVLTWYGVGAVHVSGTTSDTGPDCKKGF